MLKRLEVFVERIQEGRWSSSYINLAISDFLYGFGYERWKALKLFILIWFLGAILACRQFFKKQNNLIYETLEKIRRESILQPKDKSDNFRVEPARFFRDWQSRLKVLQRRASRKKKRSKNWEKAQLKVARVHHEINNARKNFHFQTSHTLCDQLRSSGDSLADMIFVEDIDFRLSAKGFLGKQMLDGGFGQFRDLLSWVCWKRGKYFAQVDHKYTSQICPECGTHTGKKELSERVHVCPECGYKTSRDHEAWKSNSRARIKIRSTRGLREKVRIISARRATRQEKRFYEEGS